jgi:hypothetical protein
MTQFVRTPRLKSGACLWRYTGYSLCIRDHRLPDTALPGQVLELQTFVWC